MNQIGRKIYYDKATGNIIIDTGERMGSVIATTLEQDIAAYKVLAERTPDSLGIIELEYGQLAPDFSESNGQRVNLEKLTTLPAGDEWQAIEFSYPDPNVPPDEQQPVYQAPLSEEVEKLKQENTLLKSSMLEMTTYAASQDERIVRQEQSILELTTLIAGGNA